jgi:hypothetical protein
LAEKLTPRGSANPFGWKYNGELSCPYCMKEAKAAAGVLSVEDSQMEKSLTSEAEQAEIAEIIQSRDMNFNGMSCKEAIT